MLDTLLDMPRWVLLALVRLYRLLLKPWLGNACRFEPSCSQYALDALQRGTVKVIVTSYKACWRKLPDPQVQGAQQLHIAPAASPAAVDEAILVGTIAPESPPAPTLR